MSTAMLVAGAILTSAFITSPPDAASGTNPVAELSEVGDEVPIGKNRTDEACRLQLVREGDREAGGVRPQRYHLFCEGWSQPSGEVRRFRARKGMPPTRLVSESGWQRDFVERLDCNEPESTALRDGTPAVLRQCQAQEGGWPVVVAATTAGGRSYTFEALPTNFGLLETAFEILEGKRGADPSGGATGEVSAAIRRAEALVGASGKLIGVQDIGNLDTLRQLGNNQSHAGNYRGYEATFRRALEIQERILGRDAPSAGYTLASIAHAVSLQGRFEEADQLFARAEPLVQKAFTGDYPMHLTFRAEHEIRRGNCEEALRLARGAVEIRLQRYGQGSNALAHSLERVANALEGLGRLDEAAQAYQEGLRHLEGFKAGNWDFRLWWRGNIHRQLGRIRLQQGRFADARADLDAALKYLEPLFGETVRVAETLEILGQVYAGEGNSTKALDTFRRAAAIRLRDPVARDRARVRTVAPYLGILATLADATPAQREALAAEAFAAAQIPRGGDTSRALNAMAARVASADPALRALTRDFQDAHRQRERLHMLLGAETLKPAEERNERREARLKEQVRQAEERVAQLERRLQAEAPRYMRLTAGRPITVTELAPLLRPTEALLLLRPTPDGTTFVFLVRDGKTHLHRASVGGGIIGNKVKALRTTLDLGDGAPPAFDLATAHDLYQTLLAPLGAHLTGVTHLLVVPGGPLQSLPFGLLVTKPSERGGDYRNVPWLARDVAQSVLPSVAALVDLRAVATRAAAPQPFFGVGDPAFTGQRGSTRALQDALAVCRLDEGIDVDLLRSLPRLRETAQELALIAQSLGASPASSVLLGANATKPKVVGADLGQYRVLAFATHGLLPGELRCQAEPALVLTPPTALTATDNGLLDASDIAQFRLDADWVVLSACNTAGPDGSLGGESLSGLARAFFYAGARRLLVSHWAVASRPTVALTTGLFAQAAQTPAVGRAEALRRSQLALADTPETSHPAFWAAFVLVGDGE